ncbi:18447_t:CDS:2, partial [Acaulospora morrowiae]
SWPIKPWLKLWLQLFEPSQVIQANNIPNAGLGKRKRTTKSSSKPIASSSKGFTTVNKYIGGGLFGKVFSGYYDNKDVAWKTCDAYKEQKEMKTLKHEAHIYSILKECQGHDIPRLFYSSYIYDGYLFALALQLIEGAHHKNILYEPKSCHYFFIDFGLSQVVGSEWLKLCQEERRLKRFLNTALSH